MNDDLESGYPTRGNPRPLPKPPPTRDLDNALAPSPLPQNPITYDPGHQKPPADPPPSNLAPCDEGSRKPPADTADNGNCIVNWAATLQLSPPRTPERFVESMVGGTNAQQAPDSLGLDISDHNFDDGRIYYRTYLRLRVVIVIIGAAIIVAIIVLVRACR